MEGAHSSSTNLQMVNPTPGTSSGRVTMAGTEANERSIKAAVELEAALEHENDSDTSENPKTEKPKPGKLVIDKEAFQELIGELLEDKLVVTTRGGKIAMRWLAHAAPEATNKWKKDKKNRSKNSRKSKTTPETLPEEEVNETNDPEPTASEVIRSINEHLERSPQGPDRVPTEDEGVNMEPVEDVQTKHLYSIDKSASLDQGQEDQPQPLSDDAQTEKNAAPTSTTTNELKEAIPSPKNATTPSEEHNNNIRVKQRPRLTLASMSE